MSDTILFSVTKAQVTKAFTKWVKGIRENPDAYEDGATIDGMEPEVVGERSADQFMSVLEEVLAEEEADK